MVAQVCTRNFNHMEKVVLIDIKAIEAAANKTIAAEKAEKATKGLVLAFRKLEAAKQVVRNVEAEIGDLKASIADGSYVG